MPKPPNRSSTPRPVIVARISKEKEQRGWSLDAQVAECRAWCERNLGVTVPDADIRIEDGVSGRKRNLKDRPGLNSAVEGAKAGEFSHIIFHAVDRGSRNLGVMCKVLDETQDLGVPVISAVDNQRSDTASGKSFFQMVTMMAQWQAERTSEQIKSMQRARRNEGLPNGPIPFGVMNGPEGKPVPDLRPLALPSGETTTHAGLIALMERRVANASTRDLAAWLNEQGYRTKWHGHHFSEGSIRKILHNRTYSGEIPDGNGGYRRGDFAPIVPLDLWAQVQHVNQARSIERQSAPKRSFAYSLGNGLVKCLACLAAGRDSSLLIWNSRRGSATSFGSLRCYHHAKAVCDQPSTAIRLLEEQMEWVLHGLAMDPEDARALIEAYVAHQATHQDRDEHEAALKRLEARLARQQRLYELGDWDEAQYLTERTPILEEVERLRRVMVPLISQQLYNLSDYLQDMALAWRDADSEQKRRMARLLFQAIYVLDRRIVAVRPTVAFWPLFRLMSEHANWQNAVYAGLGQTHISALPGDAIPVALAGRLRWRQSVFLPDTQWQALYAAYQSGASYLSLAEQFGISLHAVKDGIRQEKIRRGLPTRRADRPYPRKEVGR